MKARLFLILTLVLNAFAAVGSDARTQHIVVLERGSAASLGDIRDLVKSIGGEIDHTVEGWLVVTAPAESIATLVEHPAVKYAQPIGSGPEAPLSWDLPAPRTMSAPIETHAAQTWRSGTYAYDGAGNITSIGTSSVPGTQGYRTYGYDKVARLTKATIGVGTPATHEYQYDAYGNRTGYAVNSTWVPVAVNGTDNRLTDATYDAVGNQTALGSTGATYDGFGMITSYRFDGSNTETLVYTANDERIGVLKGTEWTWSFRDAGGRVLRQYRSSSTKPSAPWLWVEDFVYRGALLLGGERVAEEGGRRHYHLDHLGTPRLVTGATGSLISEHDYLPFGEERTPIGQQLARGFDREEPHHFTGHERDFDTSTPNSSSGYIDYMHARYYVATTGRFLSIDPVIGKGALRNPQMWNRYSYVANNPLRYVDPDGRLLQLAECAKSATSSGCKGQYNLLLSTFGKQSADAAKHLSIGKNGIISITGMSGRAFAAKFGLMGRATNYLVSNRVATFTINTGHTEGAANFVARDGGGGDINVDVAAFKGGKMLGGVSVSATEALVHEMAHGVSTLIQGHADTRNYVWGTSLLTKGSPRNEAYATVFENAWRRATMGPGVQIRDGYVGHGDVRDASSPDLFP